MAGPRHHCPGGLHSCGRGPSPPASPTWDVSLSWVPGLPRHRSGSPCAPRIGWGTFSASQVDTQGSVLVFSGSAHISTSSGGQRNRGSLLNLSIASGHSDAQDSGLRRPQGVVNSQAQRRQGISFLSHAVLHPRMFLWQHMVF